MRQLSDILTEKIKTIGGKAALGRALGDIPGQLIFKYTQGVSPSFDFAIKWKRAFDENLIDLLFADEKSTLAEEALPRYGTEKKLLEELNECRKELIACMKEREELKNFVGDKGKSKLKQ